MGSGESDEADRLLRKLYRSRNALSASTSVDECTDLAASAAIDVLGFDWCVILEAKPEEGLFEIAATAGETDLERGEQPMEIGEGVVGRVFETGDPEILHDAGGGGQSGRIESALTIPVGDWGVFQGLSTEPSSFDDDARRLSELFLTPLATTIQRIETERRLRDQKSTLQEKNRQIESIHAISTEMKAATSRSEVYDLVITAVEDILDIHVCTITEEEDGYLRTEAVGSGMSLEDYYQELPIEDADSAAAETYNRNETMLFADVSESEYSAASSEYQSAISVPLGDWGVFQAATIEDEAFDHTDRRLLELLANAAEAAVDRIDRERELERRAAQLERRNERLDRFAGRLSHELRNPLSVLESRVWLARETGADEHFDHIQRAITRMDRLIDDTLTLARYGEIATEKSTVSLRTVATDCWETIRTPTATLDIRTDRSIQADRDRLTQLLSNLFQNAIEHAGEEITVAVGDLETGFYIEDDGRGIPEPERAAAFDPGESELSHGTGLGLSVVEKVAKDHDWEIELTESTSGGARFEFSGVEISDSAESADAS
jgi:signal transduction histidine kinase